MSSIMGSTTMGVTAAPTAQDVTGQKEFGKCSSDIWKSPFIWFAALVMDAAFRPTMNVLINGYFVSEQDITRYSLTDGE